MLPALRTHKYIEVCQLRDRDMLPAVRTFQHSNRIGLVIFAFRVYGPHGAIVARALMLCRLDLISSVPSGQTR
jgi:hypothetical protein